nr:gamma-aminobutyric acid receptor subunit beta-like [Penaeus vannamei]
MSVTLEFFTTLAWRDERLSFQHLTPGKETPVPATQADRMWIPDFQLDLEGGQPKVLDEKVMITTANNATLPAFNSIERDLTYPGTENDLTVTRQFIAKFACSFNLHTYPFDKQECSINLQLSRAYQDRVSFSLEGWTGTYTGPEELALYTVKGWAALFLKDLNVSANLSLTNLLVLYTLFSNLLRSVPDTAAVKMIDIWFFFAISLLFLNIMVIIFLDYVAGFFLNAQTERAPRTRVSKRYERIMSLYRSAIPFAFLAFNVSYWCAYLKVCKVAQNCIPSERAFQNVG